MLKLGAEGKVIRQMGFLLAVLMGVLPMSAVADYSSHPSAAALADRVSARGVDRAWVDAALAEAKNKRVFSRRSRVPLRRVNRGQPIKIFF